ncbi:MAG: hypothetical protein ABJE95_12785 [Byssovorax sp.]
MTDPITALLAAERDLMNWIFDASPTTDDERADMTRALAFRDELHRLNNQLVLQRLQVASLCLTGQSAGLEALTARMRDESRTIAAAKHVVSIAAEVVTIAAQIAAMLV